MGENPFILHSYSLFLIGGHEEASQISREIPLSVGLTIDIKVTSKLKIIDGFILLVIWLHMKQGEEIAK